MSEPKPEPTSQPKRLRYNLKKPLRQKLGKKRLKTKDYGLGGDKAFQLEQKIRRDRDRLRSDPALRRERRRTMVGLMIAAGMQMLVLAVQTEMVYDFTTDANSRFWLSVRLSLLILCLLIGCVAVATKRPMGGAIVAAVAYLTYLGFGLLINLEAGTAAIIVQVIALLFIGRAILFGRNYERRHSGLKASMKRSQEAVAREIEADE